jgi:hypothetical protein
LSKIFGQHWSAANSLGNPVAMQQYDGLKQADDKSDGFFLAEMLRLNILPTGHICDRQVRPVRDLLRRRMSLVHKRTSLILSLKSLHTRVTGRDLGTGRIKALEPVHGEFLLRLRLADRKARVNGTAKCNSETGCWRWCLGLCHFAGRVSF